MRCGNCKKDDATINVTHVRNCYAGLPPSGARPNDEPEAEAASVLDRLVGVESREGEPMWPASPAQHRYVIGLQDERRLPDDWTIRDINGLKKMERDEVSSLITMLKSFPKGDATKRRSYSMPPGRYALPTLEGYNFYQVDIGKVGGRWEGYTFINRLIGAPGQYRKQEIGPDQRAVILTNIDADPRQAAVDFGKQSGTCGICSSPLTNAESLKVGIGPVCRQKVGW